MRQLLILTTAAFLLAAPAAGELTPQERRGKEIYLRGTSLSGQEITALMGDDAIEVPAAALPCASCHGPDGRGRPEGGVTPTNLTWEALTRPYGVRHESGREHPPYTLPLLKKAIAMGYDPAGNRLNVAMPRYRMTLDDMADLLAYLQRLGEDRDPGIEETRLRLGTVLPPEGSAGGLGDAVAALLAAYFADANASGGIYGRTLELVVRRPDAEAPTPQAALAALVEQEAVFALVAPVVSGAEAEIAALAAEHEIPVVGPFALHPQTGFPLNRQVFYLYSGLVTQGRALVDFAARRSPEAPAAVLVHAGDAASAEAAEAMARQAEEAGWPALERLSYPADGGVDALAARLAERGVAALFFVGAGGDGLALLGAAAELGSTPEVFAVGSQLGRQAFDAPAAFDGRIFLAFPTLPADASPRGVETYRRLAAEHALPQAHVASQISALASAELLLEGLKRAGRALSRERLITELEGLYDHETGLTPPLTYGPNRRVGALGAYVVAVDLAGDTLRPASPWLEIR